MSLEKIARYAKTFDLLLIGENELEKGTKDLFGQCFKNIIEIKFEKALESSFNRDLLAVIHGDARTLVSTEFKTFLQPLQNRPELIILTDEPDNVNVLKWGIGLRSLGVYPINQNEKIFSSMMLTVLPHIIKRHNESTLMGYYKTIIDNSSKQYLLFKNNKSIFANHAFKEHWKCTESAQIDQLLKSQELSPVINSVSYSEKLLTRTGDDSHMYDYFTSVEPLKEGQKLLTMSMLHAPLQNCEKPLHNRMGFIELLKDLFLIHEKENESIPISVIIVENADKIIMEYGENNYNELCKSLIRKIESIFANNAEISQWHKNVYTVTSYGIGIDDLRSKLETLHQESSNDLHIHGANIILDSFAIDLKGSELNQAIAIIDKIHERKLVSTDLEGIVYYEISSQPQELEADELAYHYMEKLFLSKASIKCLNFYKGIRISTPSKLIKLSDGLAYVSLEKIQGYAMKLEGNTLIQGANLPFDIMAKIKIIDIAKKIAVLTDFEPLKSSANNRRHIRIQSDHRMPVTLTSNKQVNSGTILDISIKSIACRITSAKFLPQVGSSTTLNFSIPLQRFDNGMTNMIIPGKVELVQNNTDWYKIVVSLDIEEPFESYLIEYIYTRQQALIEEIKTIANKL